MMARTYIIFIDILGYQEVANEISSQTNLDSSYVRQSFLRDPLTLAIVKFGNAVSLRYFTDNFLVFTNNLETVFGIIYEVSRLAIPFNTPKLVPFEVAVGVADLNTNFDPIDQDETVRFLKLDLLDCYKKYYKQEKGYSIKDTFVVITTDFFQVLSQDRRYLCKKVIYTNGNGQRIEFYSAELKMMQDVSGRSFNDIAKIEKFLKKIRDDGPWTNFEVKTLIFRDVTIGKWIAQFIYVKLLDDSTTENSVLTNSLIVIHKVYDISELSAFLNSLIINGAFQISGFPTASLEEINEMMEYYFCGYVNNYRISSPADLFSITQPAHILLKGGKSPVKLSNAETLMTQDLQEYDQFRPVIDIVRQNLSLNFWDYSYSSFFVVIAPLEIEMPKISFKGKQIEIKLRCNKNIPASDIKIKIIGRRENENTALRVEENNFKRVNEELVYSKTIESSEEDGAIVDLYNKENQFENHYVKRN
jgi:hypothetical protein